jgi:hypothetical protein
VLHIAGSVEPPDTIDRRTRCVRPTGGRASDVPTVEEEACDRYNASSDDWKAL